VRVPRATRSCARRAADALYAEVVSLIAADSATPAVPLERLAEHAAADWASGPERVSLVGQRVDRYQVVAHLGAGGMGDVYRATDSVLGRDVALKALAPALHTDADFRRRLEKEARSGALLCRAWRRVDGRRIDAVWRDQSEPAHRALPGTDFT
jgi:hypothetical protein